MARAVLHRKNLDGPDLFKNTAVVISHNITGSFAGKREDRYMAKSRKTSVNRRGF